MLVAELLIGEGPPHVKYLAIPWPTIKTSSAALPSRPRRADVRYSLRRIGPYASVVAPWRLASDGFLVIRNVAKPVDSYEEP